MTMIVKNDLASIAETFTLLTQRSDENREKFSKTLLTIYTPITSGLVFLATTFTFTGNLQKISFLTAITSGAIIVISAIIERFGYYLSAATVIKSFVNHVNKTGKHTTTQLSGKHWHNILISCQIFIMLISLFVNILATIIFVYLVVL